MSGFERIVSTFRSTNGEAASTAMRANVLDPDRDAIMVSEPFAERHGIRTGDTLSLRGTGGLVPLEVCGVFFDYGSETGFAMLSEQTYRRHFPEVGPSALALFAADHTSTEQLLEAVRGGYLGPQRLDVRSDRDLLELSLEIFDRTFAVTGALQLLCLIVAFLGIWSALMSLQLERIREIGVLRALGASPRQVGTLISAQTGILGLSAGIWALPIGATFGWILVRVINKRSFGWTLPEVVFPSEVALQAVGLALAAALLASIQPAIRFARTPIVAAIREDGGGE